MDVFQSRLDSFLKSKRVKKSPEKKTSTSATVKWFHPSNFRANPTTLAEAGFYFNPSWEDRDNVACFLCKKQLSDWASEDDPFDIHWSKCRSSCAWAIVRCGLRDDVDDDGNFIFPDSTRLPSSKAMEKARLDTFGSWPHNATRNHGASSKRMAQAGFVYTPQSPEDDTASCLYCNISLSGWDEDDDPAQEHQKRVKKSGVPCPFFTSPFTTSKKLTRTSSRSKGKESEMKPKRGRPTKAVEEPSEDEVVREPKKGRRTKVVQEVEEVEEEAPKEVVRPRRGRPPKSSTAIAGPSKKKVPPPAETDDTDASSIAPPAKSKSTKARTSRRAAGVAGKKKARAPSIDTENTDASRVTTPVETPKATTRANLNSNSNDFPPSSPVPDSDDGPNTTDDIVPSTPHPPETSSIPADAGVVGSSNVNTPKAAIDITSSPVLGPEDPVVADVALSVPSIDPDLDDVVMSALAEEDAMVGIESVNSVETPRPAKPQTPPAFRTPSPRARFRTPPVLPTPVPPALVENDVSPTQGLLSDEQKDMTVEQWVRYEIGLQYEQMKAEGNRKITSFKERALEVKRKIEAL